MCSNCPQLQSPTLTHVVTPSLIFDVGTTNLLFSRDFPGARIGAHTWLLSSTAGEQPMLYLFGGWGLDPHGTPAFLNDLWSLNMDTLRWKLLAGSIDGNRGSTNHTPAARYYGVTWLSNDQLPVPESTMREQGTTIERSTFLVV